MKIRVIRVIRVPINLMRFKSTIIVHAAIERSFDDKRIAANDNERVSRANDFAALKRFLAKFILIVFVNRNFDGRFTLLEFVAHLTHKLVIVNEILNTAVVADARTGAFVVPRFARFVNRILGSNVHEFPFTSHSFVHFFHPIGCVIGNGWQTRCFFCAVFKFRLVFASREAQKGK